MNQFDFLIVGAGFTGSVLAERLASQLDKKVLLVEKRDHIGGNAYDFYNEAGILVHKYGPHIFHTNSKKVWNYLSQFTKWRPYYHRSLATVEGIQVPIPFNLNSLYQCFSPVYARKLENLLIDEFGYGRKIPILKMKERSSGELNFLANYIYKHVFLGYTTKQWGLTPEEIDDSVTARVPIHISRDNRYFQDNYQAIPLEGYTEMFKKMIDNENIEVVLSTDFKEVVDDISFDRMIYTGPIDAYFDYLHGELPYRSLQFEYRHLEQEFHQSAGIVTYPNEFDFTRITEFKHLTGQQSRSTTIAYEFPMAHVPGKSQPYYPIPHPENRDLFSKYKSESKQLEKSVLFAGRLADYLYYDMDQAVARALNLFEKDLCSSTQMIT
ncbi:MAG: UDP-galactopyranose mutase [Bacteroidetes bacterium]|jgi:UDP-galactopyranose mutase|nr:UDP-galactopyranose mutase [Bacteroidota bacterium]